MKATLVLGFALGLTLGLLMGAPRRVRRDDTALQLQAAYEAIEREQMVMDVWAEARQIVRGERSE